MFNIILFEPEIPPNTGNIIRLCANSGCNLHLIHPLGFELEDKQLRRAGLDYSEWANVQHYENFKDFEAKQPGMTLYPCTTKASKNYCDMSFKHGDGLLFGPESRGLPAHIREKYATTAIRIPMVENSRSINLANAVSIILFEAWRQNDFSGGIV